MKTEEYRTRQEIVPMTNPKGKKYVIGLDVGYSGMKGICEVKRFCIPGYVKKIESEIIIVGQKDIMYRDDTTDELYMVGYEAQEMVDIQDTSDTDSEWYSRKRDSNPKFKILLNTAIAINLLNKKDEDEREIFLETGLPPAFLQDGSTSLKKLLTNFTPFSIRIGNSKWQSFTNIDIKIANVQVVAQPAGTLYATAFKEDGNMINDVASYLKSSTIILDFGFNTLDLYGIKNGQVVLQESLTDFGMKAILEKTSEKILNEYGIDIRIAALQKYLTSGEIPIENLEEMKSEIKPFDFLLEQASDEVFQSAIATIKSVTGGFRGYRNAVVSGGIGEAWFEKIKDWLKDMKTLNVMPCNINNNKISFIYANTLGFYMHALAMCSKQ